MRTVKVIARNLRIGDIFEGSPVIEKRFTDQGRISFRLQNGGWRRRPAEERIEIERS